MNEESNFYLRFTDRQGAVSYTHLDVYKRQQYGNPIIGIKIKNMVEKYSADPDNYLIFHTILNQVVSIIGEGRIVQKLDIFSKKKYTAEPSNQFLQQKYSKQFDGRLFKTIETLLLCTDIVDYKLKKKNRHYHHSEKGYNCLLYTSRCV